MRSEIRSAAIGGLAATFIVAAAFAPKLMSHPAKQTFHQTAAEATVADEMTPTSEPTTTEAPTTTAAPADIAPPQADRIQVVEKRVDGLDQRVTAIESQSTTTTMHAPAHLGPLDPSHTSSDPGPVMAPIEQQPLPIAPAPTPTTTAPTATTTSTTMTTGPVVTFVRYRDDGSAVFRSDQMVSDRGVTCRVNSSGRTQTGECPLHTSPDGNGYAVTVDPPASQTAVITWSWDGGQHWAVVPS